MSQYRGSTFVRSVIALAEAPGVRNALTVAQRRWGATSQVVTLMKAAVAAGSLHDDLWAGSLAESRGAQLEFLEVVRPLTIVGRLANLRRVPIMAPVVTNSSGAIAYWVGEGKAKPITAASFNRSRLDARKVVGLTVISDELERYGVNAEITIRDDLAGAIAQASDAAFIDPANTGDMLDQRPPSVTADAPEIPSSGSDAAAIRADVEAAIAVFTGNLTTAAWVMHPRTGVAIGMRLSAAGIANDLGALGGTLAGLPVLTSEGVPYDSTGSSITLLDAGSILFAEEGISAEKSNQAVIAMSDNPEAPSQVVSMWQTNSIALMVERTINWKVGRPGAVVVITGVIYSGA